MSRQYEAAVEVTDYHTAGEPFRIVTHGAPALEGRTVLERRQFAMDHADEVRQLVINEPRGHADQYGCYIVPPDDDGAEFGVIFFHKDGYSTACGHGTIAVATWAADEGRVLAGPGVTSLAIDVPSGRVDVGINSRDGAVESVAFVNVPSYVSASELEVNTGLGRIRADVSYGGAFYASVDADLLGLDIEPSNIQALIDIGREIKAQLNEHDAVRHDDHRLSGLYGTIFYSAMEPEGAGNLRQRNITVFADGEVDRSPCGSGTSARLALLHAAGEIAVGQTLEHESVIGSLFTASVVEAVDHGGVPAVTTRIEGSAYRIGQSQFVVDAADEVGLGFQLR